MSTKLTTNKNQEFMLKSFEVETHDEKLIDFLIDKTIESETTVSDEDFSSWIDEWYTR